MEMVTFLVIIFCMLCYFLGRKHGRDQERKNEEKRITELIFKPNKNVELLMQTPDENKWLVKTSYLGKLMILPISDLVKINE